MTSTQTHLQTARQDMHVWTLNAASQVFKQTTCLIEFDIPRSVAHVCSGSSNSVRTNFRQEGRATAVRERSFCHAVFMAAAWQHPGEIYTLRPRRVTWMGREAASRVCLLHRGSFPLQQQACVQLSCDLAQVANQLWLDQSRDVQLLALRTDQKPRLPHSVRI